MPLGVPFPPPGGAADVSYLKKPNYFVVQTYMMAQFICKEPTNEHVAQQPPILKHKNKFGGSNVVLQLVKTKTKRWLRNLYQIKYGQRNSE